MKQAARFLNLLAPLLLLASCATELPEQPWATTAVQGVTVSVRPASRADLVRRFGNPKMAVNPLVDYPAHLSGRRLLVFEVRVDSRDRDIEVLTRQTTLAFDGEKPGLFSSGSSRALDAKALQSAWTIYMDGTSRMPDLVLKTRRALPGSLTARKGASASGYLVFLDRFPESGGATLSLAIAAYGGEAGEIPIRVRFSEPVQRLRGFSAPTAAD